MRNRLLARPSSSLESDEWTSSDVPRPTVVTDESQRRSDLANAGAAYVPRVDPAAPVPALADDAVYAERAARLTALKQELRALEVYIDGHQARLNAAASSERAATMAAAARLTSSPDSASLAEYFPREATLRTLEELRERRRLVWAAIQLQERLVVDALNHANAVALERARPHHETLARAVAEAAVALSRALHAEEDYRTALQAGGVMVSPLMPCVPGFHGALGRLGNEFSPIRRFLRELDARGYARPRVVEVDGAPDARRR